MDESIRKTQEQEALVRLLSPYFNAGLIFCLLALGCTSLTFNTAVTTARRANFKILLLRSTLPALLQVQNRAK